MNVIETVAPIAIEDLKIYFSDENTRYIIKYEESTLKGEKLLTYLSNLDLPCNVTFTTMEGYDELLLAYLKCPFLVNVEVLENAVIDLLLQRTGLKPLVDEDFISLVEDDLDKWLHKILSLSVYNMSTVQATTFKDYVEEFEKDDTDDLTGLNFVSLLKHEDVYRLYSVSKDYKLKYYVKYFEDYMFKGKNMYSFWANENNPMFLMTFNLSENAVDLKPYIEAREEMLQELSA